MLRQQKMTIPVSTWMRWVCVEAHVKQMLMRMAFATM